MKMVPNTFARLKRQATVVHPIGYSGTPKLIPFNSEDFRKAEIFSGAVNASARGLAKLGTYMA